jgi:hypothetical protein
MNTPPKPPASTRPKWLPGVSAPKDRRILLIVRSQDANDPGKCEVVVARWFDSGTGSGFILAQPERPPTPILVSDLVNVLWWSELPELPIEISLRSSPW